MSKHIGNIMFTYPTVIIIGLVKAHEKHARIVHFPLCPFVDVSHTSADNSAVVINQFVDLCVFVGTAFSRGVGCVHECKGTTRPAKVTPKAFFRTCLMVEISFSNKEILIFL